MDPPTQSMNPSTPRKVSRRKALHEFYNLEKKESEPEVSDSMPAESSESPELPQIDDVDKFITNSSIDDILRVRNQITSKLNSQESEKKSIIYDNYYELIKLSQTLTTLENPSAKKKGDLTVTLDETNVDDDYVDQELNALVEFLRESAILDHTFGQVVAEVTESDRRASVMAIDEQEQLDSVISYEIDAVFKNGELAKRLQAKNMVTQFDIAKISGV